MGNGADKLIARFEKYGIKISDFFASDGFVRGHEFHGMRVKSFSEIKAEYPDFVIERLSGISGKITNLTPSVITKQFSKKLKEAEIPHFRFHDLRHYAVSILHAMNIPDKYIMARGGWQTNHTMNNVYNHALKNIQDEFNNKISEHFTDVYNTFD